MAGSLNRATLIGHLGQDPEMRRTRDGKPIANLSVATSESWRDRNSGERKEKTEWHRVVIFSEGLATVAEKYLSKGSKVLVEGQIQTRSWEKDGHKNYTTEIVLQGFDAKLILLDGKDSNNGGGRRDRDDDRGSRNDDRGSRGRDRDDDRGRGGSSGRASDYDDSDIPF